MAKPILRRLVSVVAALSLVILSHSAVFAENGSTANSTAAPVWYESAANKLIALGAVSPNDNFSEPVTRAEFVRIAGVALGYEKDGAIRLPVNRSAPFADIGAEGLTADRFLIFRSLGIISGDERNNANPGALISRCQAAAIVARVIKAGAGGENPGAVFKDYDKIPEWARREVSLFAQKGIVVSGGGIEFRPMDNVTRAELCVILDKALGEIIIGNNEFSNRTFNGNVTISGGNVSFKNTTIQGSLLISAAAGDVSLDNVSIGGDLIRQ